jgi:hypothetical protein
MDRFGLMVVHVEAPVQSGLLEQGADRGVKGEDLYLPPKAIDLLLNTHNSTAAGGIDGPNLGHIERDFRCGSQVWCHLVLQSDGRLGIQASPFESDHCDIPYSLGCNLH